MNKLAHTSLTYIMIDRRDALKAVGLGSAALSLGVFPWDKTYAQQAALEFTRRDFGDDFLWGVATAAYQIEGAHQEDGKSASVWDTFSHTPKKVKTGENGDIACDFYHRYEIDLDFIRQMNMQVFRFSLAWTRILPDGIGVVNQKGIDFYNRVIDTCLQKGIQPWITLYHWDLPQVLEDKGGWTNRAVLDWFSRYVEVCAKAFGDRVKNWMVLNEPMVFTSAGYMVGFHAPGKKGFKNFFPAVHHAALCQAEGARILRQLVPQANIGSTFSCSDVQPFAPKNADINATARYDALYNRLFIEPALGMGYPKDAFKIFNKMDKYFAAGDEEKIKFDFDFIGLQNYTRLVAKYALFPPVLFAKEVPATQRNVPFTEMGWEVYPEGIYNLLRKFGSYQGVKKIIVTENGAAFPDELAQGVVNDQARIDFFKGYLGQILRAKQAGVPVAGYFVWTLMDNFEWAEGYRTRFGLVYTDYTTQQRTLKNSGIWFRDFLAQ